MKQVLQTLTDTKKLAKQIIKKANLPLNNQATVLGLIGQLGAGKTTLVQYLAKELGVKQVVNSPTFVLLKEYPLTGKFKKIIHIDAYRLSSPQALTDIGLADYLIDSKNFIVIEWADKVKDILPPQTIWLELILDKQKRQAIWC
jgi:tRNA threonylcarbamoyladenosine biosynthesis protein TsaE